MAAAATNSKIYYATGRRKTSAARVFMKPGKGILQINGKTADEFLKRRVSRMVIEQPLDATNNLGKFDITITVKGGGEAGQAGAIRLGVARALVAMDETLIAALREHGYLTRDARMVERKKYGRAGARKRFQFSKR